MNSFVKREVPIYQIARGKVKFDSDVVGYDNNDVEIRFFAKNSYTYSDIIDFYTKHLVSKGWETLPVKKLGEREFFCFLKNRRVINLEIQKWNNINHVIIEVHFPNLVFHPDEHIREKDFVPL